MKDLNTTKNGLTTDQATERVGQYGTNTIPKHTESPFLQFLKTLWNPLSWVMEIAAIISIALLDYTDFALVMALLLVNSIIAFIESRQAGNAIDALMKSLAPICLCYRDGKLNTSFNPEDLVPGDLISVRIGSIVPADCTLLEGDGLLCDQSSLTGESLPVDRGVGEEVYSGSIVKRGEMLAVVHATGAKTLFGKTAGLVDDESGTGQFQKILGQVGWFCISIIAVGFIIELAVQFGVRKEPCQNHNCATLSNALVLIVGGIPVAMPTVLSVTLAIGAHQLAKKDAIVSRLTAIEELSGMDVLCSDKTGTLTKNQLSVTNPISYNSKISGDDVLFKAAISVPKDASDPIDTVLVNSLGDKSKEEATKYSHIEYHPFHPIKKTTWAKIQGPDSVFHIKKGAPQIILETSSNRNEIFSKVSQDIDELGQKGNRCIGVAESDQNGSNWKMIGLIPLFDPPRDDTKETIEKTKAKGIDIKMITGDQQAIAVETARQLGLRTNIVPGDWVRDKEKCYQEHGVPLNDLIEEAGGFAQVYPEDKYLIVKTLIKNGHIVGMTGDGVNDTAALKKADIGIAVAGATDAARSAADIVLKTPGLSVIVDAIIGSRKIFQRMKSYCVYSISMCVRVVILFVVLTTVYDWYFPTIAIVILAILNDGCMISISRDRVSPSETPDKWNPWAVFLSAIAYGCYLAVSTIVLFELVVNTSFFEDHFNLPHLDAEQLTGLVYVQISVGGLALIFVTRSHSFFFLDRPGLWVILAFIFAQVVASVIGAYGLNNYNGFGGAGWGYVAVAWVWSIIWFIPMDCCKVFVNWIKKTTLWRHIVRIHKPLPSKLHNGGA